MSDPAKPPSPKHEFEKSPPSSPPVLKRPAGPKKETAEESTSEADLRVKAQGLDPGVLAELEKMKAEREAPVLVRKASFNRSYTVRGAVPVSPRPEDLAEKGNENYDRKDLAQRPGTGYESIDLPQIQRTPSPSDSKDEPESNVGASQGK
ncbi:hypothetical protein BJ508DRAFT_324129 [Ascobolus immersus RN42]|uniref:Uncharacterized protein n=1 Tax=Ascobolus immersus RN42 TaxID=1160509 RepID=A0A3N4ICF3_ASCIM|nr:hypothetical protein BJ508DRAFT_324129 [Ascobolus immersus RN42]